MLSIALLAALALSTSVDRPAAAPLSAEELTQAVNEADARAFAPPLTSNVSVAEVQVVRCRRPGEEPTEIECNWREHIAGRWIDRRTWFAADAHGWHVID